MKPDKEYNGRSRIRMYRADCMDLMKTGTWDLAIVDPPYGINYNRTGTTYSKGKGGKGFYTSTHYKSTEWDKERPKSEYFDSLIRITDNQIIWGGNYFADLLPASRGWIYWDKKISNSTTENYSDGELAWSSFDCVLKKFTYDWIGFGYINNPQKQKRIHKTEKPINLYKWLLTNYAKEGDTIFDSHGGSMSIAIACWDLGFDLDICELDTDYFNDAVKRFENHVAQTQLF